MLASTTAAQLQHLIDTAPAAVRELMANFGCTVAPSVEALALLNQVKGDAFTDELFILLRQTANLAGAQRVAQFTGTPMPPPSTTAQRTKLRKTLDDIAAAAMAAERIANGSGTGTPPPPNGGTGGNDGSDENADTPLNNRILGLSPPVFYAGCAVLLLLLVVLLTRKSA